jgi:hydrogenase-4 component F
MLLYYFILSFLIITSVLLHRSKFWIRCVVLCHAAFQVCLNVYAFIYIESTDLKYFTYDNLGVLFLTVLTIISLAAIYHGFIYQKDAPLHIYKKYHAAFLALITFVTGVYLANDITAAWILVEATTLSVAVLIYNDRTKLALEATWKYVFVCSVGIALAYLGILFLSISLSHGHFTDMSFTNLAAAVPALNPIYLQIAFLFVLVGYSTKMELFPMHTVGIDANSVAPPPVGAFMSTAMVNLGFVSIFRIYKVLSNTTILAWMNHILLLAGTLSVVVAAGYMLKAKHNKRMLAYSSLENMGLVAIGIGIGGLGCFAAILLLVLHSFVKSSLFFQLGQAKNFFPTHLIRDWGHYMKIFPAGALVMLLGMICLIAIPPSGIFISEYFIFRELVIRENWLVLVVTILFLIILLYALTTRILHILYSATDNDDLITADAHVSVVQTFSQFILLGTTMFLCFYQPQFLTWMINNIISGLIK